MSQRTRVKKLEETGGIKPLVLVPVFEDSTGQIIKDHRLPDDVTLARFFGDEFQVTREPDEEPSDFERRAILTARDHFKPCYVVRHYTASF